VDYSSCSAISPEVFVLWVNLRRCRVEGARQRGEYDAIVDDTVIRAVELFGHPESSVRCGALHALAELAGRRPARVVRLVCAYLRTVPAGDSTTVEAQKVLYEVVREANAATPPVEDLEIDLTGAWLTGFVFDDAKVRALTLAGACLTGRTSLRGLGSRCRVELDGAAFAGDVWLHDARLRRLSARGTEFRGDLTVTSSTVELDVELSDSSVDGEVDLSRAQVGKLVANSATFGGVANFRRTAVAGGASFLQAHFDRADFAGFTCQHTVLLDGAHFARTPRLPTDGDLQSVSLCRTTVGEKVGDLPAPWRLTTVDDLRYLMVDEVTG
jgi:uncharacterized protein YjbI with pentapeptide repeats